MRETLAIAVVIIIVIFGLSFMSRNKIDIPDITALLASEQATRVSIRDMRFQSRFEEPCFFTITGAVENKGNAAAREVVVNCIVEDRYKNPLSVKAEFLGDIEAGSAENFLLRMNTICIDDVPVYRCRAECINC